MDLGEAILRLLQGNSQGNQPSENTTIATTTAGHTGTGCEPIVVVNEESTTATASGGVNDDVKEVEVKLEGLLTLQMIKDMKKEKKGKAAGPGGKPRSRKGSEADAQDNWRLPNDNNNPTADLFNNNNIGGAGSTGNGRRLRRYGSGSGGSEDDLLNNENNSTEKWGFFGKRNFDINAKKLAPASAKAEENENVFEDGQQKCVFEKKRSFNFTEEPSLNYTIRQPRGPDTDGGIGFAGRRQLVDLDKNEEIENIP